MLVKFKILLKNSGFWPSDSDPESRVRATLFGLTTVGFLVLPFIVLPGLDNPLMGQLFVLVWLATALVATITVSFLRGHLAPIASWLFVLVGIWLGAKVVATLTSILPHRSIWGAYGSPANGLLYLVIASIMIYAFLSSRPRQRGLTFIIQAIVLQSLVLSLLTIIDAANKGLFVQAGRPDSPLFNSDYFISYAVLVLPLGVALFVDAVRHARQGNFGGRWIKPAFYGLQVVCLATALFFTLPTGLQAGIRPANQTGLSPIAFLSNSSNVERWTQWKAAWLIGLRRPLVGSGPGTTRAAFYDLIQSVRFPSWNYDTYMEHAHNDLLEQWSQTGLIGLLAYVIFLAGSAWLIWRHRDRVTANMRPYAWGISGGLILFLLFNQFLFTTLFPGLIALLWLAILFILTDQVGAVRNLRRLYPLSLGAMTIVMAIFSFLAVGYARAEQQFHLGALAYSKGDPESAVRALDRATKDYAYEDTYPWLKSVLLLSRYLGSRELTPQDKEILGQASLAAAQRAIYLNRHIPLYQVDAAAIAYLTAEANSPQETTARDALMTAAQISPFYYLIYMRAADAFYIKGDIANGDTLAGQALAVADNKVTPKLQSHLTSQRALAPKPER